MNESFAVLLTNDTSSYDTWGESESTYINWDESSSYSGENESSVDISTSHPEVQLPYNYLVAIAMYLTVVGLISTIGNILFIVTVMRWWIMRNNAHMLLLLNMAICDLAISVTGYPYTTISAYAGRWIFGEVMCQLYGFLCFTLSQVSMNTLVAVSIFRYIAICRPHFKHLLTRNASSCAIVGVWIHALFWTSPPLFGWSAYALEPNGIACSFDWNDRSAGGISYVLGCIIFCYITHLGIMTGCYAKIFFRMHNLKQSHDHRRSKSQLQRMESQTNMTRCEGSMVFSFITENLSPLEIHVLRMNIIMVLTYTLIWSPYAIISLVSLFYTNLSPTWYIFPTIFAKTSCMMNPIIYGLTNKFLRKELLSVIRRFFGLTTPIEEFQFMQQRQQEGLYDKEGIYRGLRNVAAGGLCSCDGCIEARKHANRLSQQQQERLLQLNSSRNPSPVTVVESSSTGRENATDQVKQNKELLLSPTSGIDIVSGSSTKTLISVSSLKTENTSRERSGEMESTNPSRREGNCKCSRSMSLVIPSRNGSSNSTPSHNNRRRNSYGSNHNGNNGMKTGLAPNAKIISHQNDVNEIVSCVDVIVTETGRISTSNKTRYRQESAV